jgi:hypothetical protein
MVCSKVILLHFEQSTAFVIRLSWINKRGISFQHNDHKYVCMLFVQTLLQAAAKTWLQESLNMLWLLYTPDAEDIWKRGSEENIQT